MTGDEHELERTTLTFVNAVAYASSSRGHSQRFKDATGWQLATSELRLLEYLTGRPPTATGDIARALGVDISQVSRQVGILTRLGHLTRSSDEQDGRRVLVALSPTATSVLDAWLSAWAAEYAGPIESWPSDHIANLTAWFARVHRELESALPGRPLSTAPRRWQAQAAHQDMPAEVRDFVATVVGLVAWVGQSGGFNDLLEQVGAPIRQHAYFTLRTVVREGPLTVAALADKLSIERPQASKRVAQLTEHGLLRRQQSRSDRRSSLLVATRRGRNLVAQVRQTQLHDLLLVVDEIPETDRALWTPLLSRYVHDLLGVGSPPVVQTADTGAAEVG